MNRKPLSVNPLVPGDVLRTHPARGFWGCALVLSARDGVGKTPAMSHIGITGWISKRKFDWADIPVQSLELLRLETVMRVGPGEYYRLPDTPLCIGAYSLLVDHGLAPIGRIDPNLLHPVSSLDLDEVGDGTDGHYPWCGPVPEDLGHEAVLAWRRMHDADRLARENEEEMRAFEEMEAQRLEKARKARKARQ